MPEFPRTALRERGEGGTLAHWRCATRQAHARVRRDGREGEGQRATDLGRFGEENQVRALERCQWMATVGGLIELAPA